MIKSLIFVIFCHFLYIFFTCCLMINNGKRIVFSNNAFSFNLNLQRSFMGFIDIFIRKIFQNWQEMSNIIAFWIHFLEKGNRWVDSEVLIEEATATQPPICCRNTSNLRCWDSNLHRLAGGRRHPGLIPNSPRDPPASGNTPKGGEPGGESNLLRLANALLRPLQGTKTYL